ncbi:MULTISPECIES: FAD-dependent oxidoreductase [Kitasatospora]|uniref:Putative oxidoreductase n=1 Tax=Kitasatospora setae (strain ATCC 33774 / DSM 43861 / JCM 3304 / KCC A-0304 / NBRC 14216 / KM-6054) TaxID=452652 RepID=E4N0I2_KITSK|nr:MULTISPECIES: FAD-dependent oxidoreductase [Kitasatospora]BAJ31666.1 putative oxidoreductase [Kitasatospora setae KM-6054]
MTRTLVVVGHGMTGQRLVEDLRARDRTAAWRVVVLGEERHPAYDRVALSSYLDGRSAADLSLVRPGLRHDALVEFRHSTRAVAVDRTARTVRCADGGTVRYDALVLATGSRPFVPPVPGHDLPGCFVYRTLDDLDAIRDAAAGAHSGVVIGGGLLGLEAANALRLLGLRPHVVEMAPRLMPVQVDDGGGRVLARLVSALGVRLHLAAATRAVEAGPDGRAARVRLADGTAVDTGLVVFSAGVRPQDALAADAGLPRAERGGFLVDDHCRTADERIWAIGECAAVEGRCYGLVAPGYRMAEAVVGQLLGEGPTRFPGADLSTRLKLLGVDVASFGDAHAQTPGALEYTRHLGDTRYAKLVLDEDGTVLLGGVLAGDTRAYPVLHGLLGRELPAPADELLGTATGLRDS